MSQPSTKIFSRWRQRFDRLGLGARLTVTLLPLVLIPMLILALVSYFRARDLLQTQASDQMAAATQAQIQVLAEWSAEREQRLQLGAQRPPLQQAAADLIALSPQSQLYTAALETALAELNDIRIRQGQTLFSDLLIAQPSSGLILAATQEDWSGRITPNLTSQALPPSGQLTLPLFNDPVLASHDLAFLTLAPFRAAPPIAEPLLLVGVNQGPQLAQLLEQMQIFWEQRGVYRVERGRTFMLLEPDILVQLPRYAMAPEAVSGHQHPIFPIAEGTPAGTLEYVNADGNLVLAAYEWIPEWNLGIVAELPQADIFAEANSLAPFTLLLLISVVLVVGLVVPLATRRAIRPLAILRDLAERFAAGDLDARVEIERGDEIGVLSQAFNLMANELSDLYRSLERRVEERTKQIRTASEVARDAVAIRDVESLLEQTVHLISSRFGYYHAGVFLVDADREYAVLRAASSEGGKRMIARGHKLPVGKVGIVGYVTGTGNPRIALDVGGDQVHFANPDLPETRSELALPLWSGDQIIGALDVQSKDPNAFEEEDVIVLQTMADQLAVAIENARLIEELTDLSSLNRKVIEVFSALSQFSEYDALLAKSTDIVRERFGFRRVALGLLEGEEIIIRSAAAESGEQAAPLGIPLPLARGPLGRAVETRQPVVVREGGPPPGKHRAESITIAVPLIQRDEAIGALAVEMFAPEGVRDRDLEILELVAGQVAASLENTRLLEETRTSLEQLDSLYRRQTADSWQALLELLQADRSVTSAEFVGPRYPDAITDGGDPLEAPIEIHGETIGLLEVLGEKPGEWTEDEREIVRAVADEVAAALEQTRLLEELQRRAAQLQTAAEVARDATGLLDINTLLRRTVRLIQERFGYHHIAVFLTDEQGQYAEIAEGSGAAGEQMKSEGHRLEVGSESIIGHVTLRGEHYLADQVDQDSLFKPHPALPDTQTELAIPLLVGERIIGALDVQHDSPGAFSADDIAVLQILADQLAVAIQNARLFEETLQRARREQLVLQLTGEVRKREDVEGMLKAAVREMRKAMGAKRSRIRLYPRPLDSDEANENGPPPSEHPPAGDQPFRGDGE